MRQDSFYAIQSLLLWTEGTVNRPKTSLIGVFGGCQKLFRPFGDNDQAKAFDGETSERENELCSPSIESKPRFTPAPVGLTRGA